MGKSFLAILFGALLVLSSCTNSGSSNNMSPAERAAESRAIVEAHAFVSGATNIDRTSTILQIEYHRPDGRAFLWFPGNRSILTGQWDIRRSPFGPGPYRCYRYDTSTNRKPFGSPDDGATCIFIDPQKERYWFVGDPYKLSTRGLPFVMRRGPDAYSEVIRRTGVDPANLRRR